MLVDLRYSGKENAKGVWEFQFPDALQKILSTYALVFTDYDSDRKRLNDMYRHYDDEGRLVDPHGLDQSDWSVLDLQKLGQA